MDPWYPPKIIQVFYQTFINKYILNKKRLSPESFNLRLFTLQHSSFQPRYWGFTILGVWISFTRKQLSNRNTQLRYVNCQVQRRYGRSIITHKTLWHYRVRTSFWTPKTSWSQPWDVTDRPSSGRSENDLRNTTLRPVIYTLRTIKCNFH